MYVYICVYIYLCLYTYIYICMYVCIYVYVYIYVYIYMCMYMYIFTYIQFSLVPIYIYTYLYIYIHMHTYRNLPEIRLLSRIFSTSSFVSGDPGFFHTCVVFMYACICEYIYIHKSQTFFPKDTHLPSISMNLFGSFSGMWQNKWGSKA